MSDNIRIYASEHASGREDDSMAVVTVLRTAPQVLLGMTIAQARDISNRLARAADDAELKLAN